MTHENVKSKIDERKGNLKTREEIELGQVSRTKQIDLQVTFEYILYYDAGLMSKKK